MSDYFKQLYLIDFSFYGTLVNSASYIFFYITY